MAVVSGSRRSHVLGVPVDLVDMAGTLAWVEERISTRQPGTHLCVNAANVVRAHDEPDYRALLDRGDLVGCDGQSVVWAGRLLRCGRAERIAGIDLMTRVLQLAAERGWRIYLLGAKSHVVTRLAEQLRSDGVQVVGARDGYFAPGEQETVVEDIRRSDADVLFVGMPTPVKERFIVEHADKAGVPACIGVGGSFDVLAGELRRAPRFVQRLGLEWLFRLIQEPRRLFARYAVTNTRFCVLVLRAMFQRGPKAGRS